MPDLDAKALEAAWAALVGDPHSARTTDTLLVAPCDMHTAVSAYLSAASQDGLTRDRLASALWDSENTNRFSEVVGEDREETLRRADSILGWLKLSGRAQEPSASLEKDGGNVVVFTDAEIAIAVQNARVASGCAELSAREKDIAELGARRALWALAQHRVASPTSGEEWKGRGVFTPDGSYLPPYDDDFYLIPAPEREDP